MLISNIFDVLCLIILIVAVGHTNYEWIAHYFEFRVLHTYRTAIFRLIQYPNHFSSSPCHTIITFQRIIRKIPLSNLNRIFFANSIVSSNTSAHFIVSIVGVRQRQPTCKQHRQEFTCLGCWFLFSERNRCSFTILQIHTRFHQIIAEKNVQKTVFRSLWCCAQIDYVCCYYINGMYLLRRMVVE